MTSNDKLRSSTLPRSSHIGHSHSHSQLHPSENHLIAKENSIGLRVNEPSEIRDQPNLPPTIRNKIDSVHLIADTRSNNYRSLSSTNAPSSEGHGLKEGSLSHTSLKDYYTEEDIKEMIVNRERHFYKEISKNPQLSHQHPLIHLINSQQKLLLADEQSGVLNTKTRGAEGIYPSYTKPEARNKAKYHSYQEKIQFVGPSSPHRSGVKGKRSLKPISGSRSLASYASSSTAKSLSTMDLVNESSKKHSDFLTETLQMVNQMETENSQTDPLMEAVGEKGLLLKTKLQNKNQQNLKKKGQSQSQGPKGGGSSGMTASSSLPASPAAASPSPSGTQTPTRNQSTDQERQKLLSRHDLAVEATGGILSEGMSRAVQEIIDSEGEEN
jgi:hypothetical protein